MTKISNFYLIKEESKNEIYEYIDKNLKKLPRKDDGSFNEFERGFVNNDVDALRHSFVSGVYTMEYGEGVADLLGRLNELTNITYGKTRKNEENMDLWNNSVGRKYGKKADTKENLIKFLIEALEKGELIVDPDDEREYSGAGLIKRGRKGLVIVLQENESGRNELFYDVEKKKLMLVEEFVQQIEKGNYTNYSVRMISGLKTPVSKRDGLRLNNLG